MNHRFDADAADEEDSTFPGERIEPRKYIELVLSNRRLWRCKLSPSGIIGLLDPKTGKRYWIDEESLLSAHHGQVRRLDV